MTLVFSLGAVVQKYPTFKTTCSITNTAGLSSCLVPPFSRMVFTYDNQAVNTMHGYGSCMVLWRYRETSNDYDKLC